MTVGVSGDAAGAAGLNAGCEAWYSVVGGLFPGAALAIVRAARRGHAQDAARLSAQLEPLWALFRRHGSLRVMAAAAELQGLVAAPSLPLPLKALRAAERQELGAWLDALEVA